MDRLFKAAALAAVTMACMAAGHPLRAQQSPDSTARRQQRMLDSVVATLRAVQARLDSLARAVAAAPATAPTAAAAGPSRAGGAYMSIGDAVASNDGRAARSQVEDTTRAGCKTPHADDCTVCRYLTALAVPASPDAPSIPRLMRGELTGLARASGGSHDAHGFLSRAPPGLSA